MAVATGSDGKPGARNLRSTAGFGCRVRRRFSEPDDRSGLKRLRQLSREALRDEPGFVQKVSELENSLDYDTRFAGALQGHPAALGYYFTSDRDGGHSGALPAPVDSMIPGPKTPRANDQLERLQGQYRGDCGRRS